MHLKANVQKDAVKLVCEFILASSQMYNGFWSKELPVDNALSYFQARKDFKNS